VNVLSAVAKITIILELQIIEWLFFLKLIVFENEEHKIKILKINEMNLY